MRPLPLFRLSNPAARAVRLAAAAGTIAGLAVLGACTDATKTVSSPVLGPRNSSITNTGGTANGGTVKVCIDASSPPGTYTFVNAGTNSGVETDISNSTNDGADGGTGTTVPNTTDGTQYTVGVGTGGCVTVLTRTAPDLTFPTFPDTKSATTIEVATTPAGVIYDHTDCLNELVPAIPDPCGTGNSKTRAYMNFEHGSVITFFFTGSVTGHNCTFTQGYYKNHEVYTAGVLSSNVSTTYIDAAGKLIIGTYHLSAAQIDDIYGANPGHGYNAGGVVFTKDQLPMIHQLITAELNIAGGASPAAVAATITAANAGYTGASKSTLSTWTDTLDAFNNGKSGVDHCS